MATDVMSSASGRPRPWLLVLLGLTVVAFVVSQMFSGGTAVPAVPSTAQRGAPPAAAGKGKPVVLDPAELDVKIESLSARQTEAAEVERNPFRFQPKPAPPPPPVTAAPPPVFTGPPKPVEPPGPPPIGNTIKFIGIVETANGRLGAFTDCKASFPGREGEIIEGRYKVVRIGVESATLEYPDGTGRATLPLNGSACVK